MTARPEPVPTPLNEAAPDRDLRERVLIGLALFAVYFLWGSTYLAILIALEGFPPMLMAGVRFLLAGIALYAALRLRGAVAPTRTQWLWSGATGTLLLVGGNGGVVIAEQWVASGLAALGVATVPIWTALFAGLWGRWPGRIEWVGLVIGFAGVVLLNLGGDLRSNPLGALALLVASLSWSFGSIWSKRLDLPNGLMSSAAQMLGASAVFLLVSAVLGERMTAMPDTRPVLALLYLTVFGSLVAFSAYNYLLRRVTPALATSYAYVNPAVAIGLGVLLANERISAVALVAMVVILSGVAMIGMGRGRS